MLPCEGPSLLGTPCVAIVLEPETGYVVAGLVAVVSGAVVGASALLREGLKLAPLSELDCDGAEESGADAVASPLLLEPLTCVLVPLVSGEVEE